MARTLPRSTASLQAWAVPRIVYPTIEAVTGRKFWTLTRQMQERQWWPAAELEARAAGRLRELAMHAHAHVPFYRDLFDGAGFDPRGLGSVMDLVQAPVVSKAEVRSHFPDGVVARNLPASRRFLSHTSGSTGTPTEFYIDLAAEDVRLASYLFHFWAWTGLEPGDCLLVIATRSHRAYAQAGPRSKLASRVRKYLLGQHVALVETPGATWEQLRDAVAALGGRPYVVWAFPSYAARLGLQLGERHGELASYPHAVVVSGEGFTPTEAESIRQVFRSPLVNHYTTIEVPHLAQSCPDGSGLLHVNEERAFVRIVRPDGRDAEPGQEGRVVVTDLANHVMPLINYDLGDWAVAGGPCPCGRASTTLQGVVGRVVEVVRTPGGKVISPAILCYFMQYRFPTSGVIAEFQAIQTEADQMRLDVVPTPRFTPDLKAQLARDLAAYLGDGMRVEVGVVKEVATEPSGKRLIIRPPAHPTS